MLLLMLTGCSMLADQYGAPLDPSATEAVEFTVPPGTSPRALGPLLQDAGVVGSSDDFVTYVKITKEGSCIKAGRFSLSPAMSAGEILTVLCGAALPDDVPFTVIEGWRIREIDAALAAKGWTEPGEYAALAAQPDQFVAPFPLPAAGLEGYLYPETYMVIPDKWDTEVFIQRQIDLLVETWYTPHSDTIGASERSVAELVIMASMLEREEPKPVQRPMVAGILWKRIDHSWNLGVDATSRYTLDKWNDRKAFLKKLRDPSDPYNTRLRGGLPPTAIGNPTLSSLTAATSPEDSEWWFYLHDNQQVLHPARDQAGHEANRRKYNVY